MASKSSIAVRARLLTLLAACLIFASPISAQQSISEAQVRTYISNWLDAWQAQDIDAYFGFYHPDFQPSAFADVSDWRQSRTRNISRPQEIAITLEETALAGVNNTFVIVNLGFVYQSPDYADRTRKQLRLATENGRISGILSELNLSVDLLTPDANLLTDVPVNSAEGFQAAQSQAPPEMQVQDVQVLADAAQITAFLENWLQAWENQDTNAYFSAYHAEFQPAAFRSRQAWAENRVANITRPQRIAISLENFSLVRQDNDTATVRISMLYRSPTYADRTQKELVIALSEGEAAGILEEINLSVERLPDQVLTADEEPPAELPVDTTPPESEEQPVVENTLLQEQVTQAAEPEQEVASSAVAVEESVPPPAPAPRRTAVNADWVPPGFENLNQPQVTEIDVYYGGYFLTSVLAEFTDQQVTVLDIDGLLAQLSSLKNPESFRTLMSDSLDAHTEALCFSEFQIDCGTLETDSVDVIFDRSLLRMWLFINPELLQDADENIVRFLPPSEAGLAFMNQTAAYFTTREFNLDTYNLFNNTLFSWGENRFSMRSNLVSDEGFDIDTLAFFREFEGRDYRLGLVREDANGFSFMANERFAGAAYASSLLTRADLERSLGTEIELYFPIRSRVEIYREGRLISSDYYSVGNHLIDTSDLPNGSYMIELRIIDAAGRETREERFYSKTANIPPADQPLFFFHVGRVENDLDINRLSRTGQDEVLVRGGFSKRLGRTLGGSIGFSVVEDTSFVELGMFKQGQNFEFQANAAYENTGASGVDVRLRYRHPMYNLVLNGRQVFNGLQESQIGLDYQQYNAILEVPTRSGYYSFFHRHVERPQSGKNLNTGLRYRSHGKELFDGVLSNSFELSKNGDEVLALLNFTWSLQGRNRSSVYSPTLAYANEHSGRDSGLYGSYESNWFRGQQGGNEYIYSLRGDYDTQSSMEARMEADTRLGTADITGRYNETNNELEMNGRLSTSFATTGRATAIGGKRRSESAFLVRVEGEMDTNARFNVLVNGSVRGQLGAEETLLIPVSPYNTYEVELRAVGDTLVDLENRIYRETMYPGNVVNLSWSSQVINIGIGRLVDEQGEPLVNAVIQNVVGIALTDDNGVFQAEINHDTRELDVLKGSTRCTASFDNPRTNATILSLGTLVCRQ